jgi:hypothetical protein
VDKELHILPPNSSLQVKEIAEVFLCITNYIRILFTREKAYKAPNRALQDYFQGHRTLNSTSMKIYNRSSNLK